MDDTVVAWGNKSSHFGVVQQRPLIKCMVINIQQPPVLYEIIAFMKIYCITTQIVSGEVRVNDEGVVARAFPAYRNFIGKKFSRLEGWVKLHKGTIEEIENVA